MLSIIGCSGKYPPLGTVSSVDVSRYAGKWYEIARLPNRFEKNCTKTTAEYGLIDSETISVINTCTDSTTNKTNRIEGKAFVVPGSNNAKLKVQFFWPFRGDYWIIDLDKESYNYALVGAPSREYLWILCRKPKLETEVLNRLLLKAKSEGFETEKMIYMTE